MRYFVQIGDGDAAYRCEVRFEEAEQGLRARLTRDGAADRVFPVDPCSLERGRGLHLLIGDESHDFYLETVPGGYDVHYRGDHQIVEVADERELLARSIHGDAKAGPREIRASMPGIVVAVHVEPEQQVTNGETILILEAMKMQNPIAAEGDGKVARVHVAAGQAVAAGEVLITLE